MTTKMELADVASILHARKFAYDILRRLFIEEPVQDFLKVFVHQKMAENFPFAGDSEGIDEGIHDIKEYLEQNDPVYKQEDFDALHWDFTRMFIGPFELPAPPWESVYVRKDQLLFQQHTMNVRKTYNKYGFVVKEQNLEADDHVGLELDFIYHLNQLCLDHIENNPSVDSERIKNLLKEQHIFLQKHLLAFVPEFANRVVENAETKFYQGMAKILKSYLQIDSEVLKELLEIDYDAE